MLLIPLCTVRVLLDELGGDSRKRALGDVDGSPLDRWKIVRFGLTSNAWKLRASCRETSLYDACRCSMRTRYRLQRGIRVSVRPVAFTSEQSFGFLDGIDLPVSKAADLYRGQYICNRCIIHGEGSDDTFSPNAYKNNSSLHVHHSLVYLENFREVSFAELGDYLKRVSECLTAICHVHRALRH